MRTRVSLVSAAVVAVALAACAAPTTTTTTTTRLEATVGPGPTPAAAAFPEVVSVAVEHVGGDTFRVSATISSPYDSEDRYADAFRVLAPDGTELGVRELTHPHADEQPFSRSIDLTIPGDVDEVTIQGRDSENGWGGPSKTAPVPRD